MKITVVAINESGDWRGDMTMNEKRAGRIADALLVMNQKDEITITDMITDIMHYCDVYGYDFGRELSMATINYNEEAR